jgi:hypothetical protein
MGRSRKSARGAGTRLERQTADALKENGYPFADRQVKTGAKGDVANFFTFNEERIALECKDVVATNLSGWVSEADEERVNAGAIAGFVVHKRRGVGDPLSQYVTGTLRDLIAVARGTRPD